VSATSVLKIFASAYGSAHTRTATTAHASTPTRTSHRVHLRGGGGSSREMRSEARSLESWSVIEVAGAAGDRPMAGGAGRIRAGSDGVEGSKLTLPLSNWGGGACTDGT